MPCRCLATLGVTVARVEFRERRARFFFSSRVVSHASIALTKIRARVRHLFVRHIIYFDSARERERERESTSAF